MFPQIMRTHGSIQKSLTRVENFGQICEENDFVSVPLTDIDSLSQCVAYSNAMVKASRKPVYGLDLKIGNERGVIYARNQQGWEELLRVQYLASKHEGTFLTEDEASSTPNENLIFVGDHRMNLNVKCFFPAYYPRTSTPIFDNSVILTNNFYEKSKKKLNTIMDCIGRKLTLETYDNGNEYDYIHNREDLHALGLSNSLIDNSLRIFDMIEPINIIKPQTLPDFPTPNGISQKTYIKELCLKKCPNDPVYQKRLQYELDSIGSADMEGYFLIVQDIVNYVRQNGFLVGVSRGSAGGCLISYLLGITGIDPIKYDLMFERFYTPDRGSLPDIDLDFPKECKDSLIHYIKNKYGEDKFAQICTFNTIGGSSAIKSVIRVLGSDISFGEQNSITESLPFASKIQDELEDMFNQEGTRSLILWTLKNKPKALAKWCTLKDGMMDGSLKEEMEYAIELDKAILNRGRHASAFVLSNLPLYKSAPLVYDSVSSSYIIGVDMYGAEPLGLVKMDLLGLTLLSKCQYMKEIINGTKTLPHA